MIRINLLKPLQTQSAPNVFEESTGKRKKMFLVGGGLVLAVLAAVAVLQYPSLLGGLLVKKKQVVEKVDIKPPEPVTMDTLKPKHVTANAVEETVADVGPSSEKPPTTTTYDGMVPSEKIEFQYFASARILKDIKSVTPPDVGFANFIFTPPGDFYLHGLAGDKESYEHFKRKLSALESVTLKPGLDAKAGSHGSGKEFSFYGTIVYPLNAIPVPPDHTFPKANLKQELEKLKTVAAGMGLKLKEPRLVGTVAFGNLKRLVYESTLECNFQQMQDLIEELHHVKSNLGIARFALHASGDEKVVAELDILAYVN